MRYSLTIAYNGTYFLGSQQQKESSNTILGQLQKVFNQINVDSKIVASGRTDKGVHATGQVCHINLPNFWSDTKKLKRVLNSMLPSSIYVKKIKPVDNDFHARYSAKKRIYRYIIKTGDSNPFEADFVTFIKNIDLQKVQKNIKLFTGRYDFQNFMKTGSDVDSTVREIYRSYAYRYKDYIILNFEANGFLRTQIRFMVSAVLNLDATQIMEKLECKKNYKIKPAPSNGLYLAKIKY
jgi:tRNA pseudouridine38-40 synthase